MECTELSKFNKFSPLIDSPDTLPNDSGIYLICAKGTNSLPNIMETVVMKFYNGMPIIYAGISNKSIRARDYKNHFTGSARNSSLRKSLGVLFGYKKRI